MSCSNRAASSVVLGFLIPLALLTIVTDLKRSLPIQNIITIVGLIVLISSILEIVLNRSADYPLDEDLAFAPSLGPPWFHFFRWRVPLLWAVNLLNSRSAARLMLRRWHGSRNYGLLSLGLTALLTAIVSNLGIDYFGGIEPKAAFFICAATASIIPVAITPWLINKKSSPSPAPGYYPLVVWVALLGILFGSLNCMH